VVPCATGVAVHELVGSGCGAGEWVGCEGMREVEEAVREERCRSGLLRWFGRVCGCGVGRVGSLIKGPHRCCEEFG